MSDALADPRIARGMAAQAALRANRSKAGERVIGWKVGFGAPAVMEKLGLKAPLIGFLTDRALLEHGASVSLAGWVKPAAEAEVAVYLGSDVPGGASRAAAGTAIAAIGPAIELADVDAPPDDVERILAGDIYQRHVMLGTRDSSRAGSRLDGLTARIARNGAEFAATRKLQELTGDHVDIVRHVADTLAALGERLAAGEFIITGSITPPLWIAAGETLRFDLDPVGSLAVRFTA
jgi:2-keto-4-pentenoate hydratase